MIAQSGESPRGKDGGPDYSLIWTDVWMWRNGESQIVASQDSVPPNNPLWRAREASAPQP